ncbi:MAG: DUF5615 family PIN-like protein [Lewinellaceae bacterium]|nr:DUF5615 family PIN-like protein [Lewinellaceae bacterium]
MKFVADEGVDRSLVALIREAGHDILYFAETDRGTDDEVILAIANDESRILITRDKDFGELVYRLKKVHSGIILIRADEMPSITRSQLVADFIQININMLAGYFVVIQPGVARIRNLR